MCAGVLGIGSCVSLGVMAPMFSFHLLISVRASGSIYTEINPTRSWCIILPFAATWVDLENIMLSEIRQRKTNTV